MVQGAIVVEVVVLNKKVHLVRGSVVAATILLQKVDNLLRCDLTGSFSIETVEGGDGGEVPHPTDVLAEAFKNTLVSAEGEEQLSQMPFRTVAQVLQHGEELSLKSFAYPLFNFFSHDLL